MTNTVTQSKTELEAHLAEHIGFLEASAAAFDAGHEGEAKRLAVSIRVLVHDTAKSQSLLGQLGLKDSDFWDTALDPVDGNLATHGGLVYLALGGGRTRYVAMLDQVPPPCVRAVSFATWWSKPIFVDSAQRRLTRRDLVLAAANQDGGAHVDPKLDATYAALSRANSLAFMADEGAGLRPMDGPERAALRQIAHEVLKSIKSGYSAQPQHAAGMIASTFSFRKGSHPPALRPTEAPRKQVGRNEPCPCGSGQKFKRCHGAVAR